MGFFSAIGSVVGSAIGGPVGGTIGGTIGGAIDGKSASSSASSASSGAAQARADVIESSKLEVATAQGQIDRFESIYGNIEKNLGSFYSTLTPERVEAIDLQNHRQEFQQATEKINQSFAQRGLKDSGLSAAAETEALFRSAETEAKIRSDAPFKVAQAQQDFLSIGLGQGESARNRLAAAERGRTANLAGVASDATIAAQNAAKSAGNVIGDFLGGENLSKSIDILTGGFSGGSIDESGGFSNIFG